jgi:hypothetical protein
LAVEDLEFENPTRAGEVEAFGQEAHDAAEDHDVVVAVSTSSSRGAGWGEESLSLIETEGLLPEPGQLRGHGDAVDASVAVDLIRHRFLE